MSMLREIAVKDRERRWFSSPEEDLYLYLNNEGDIESIEYCYGKTQNEHVLIIKSGSRYKLMKVDDGEQEAGSHKGSPIYVVNGSYDLNQIVTGLGKSISTVSREERSSIMKFVLTNTGQLA